MGDINSEIDGIAEGLARKQDELDLILRDSRAVIRLAAQAITIMHNDGDAKQTMAELSKKVAALKSADADFRNTTLQAYQEYAEAAIFSSIKTSGVIPDRESVGVDDEAYLMGMMDCVGELKREVTERLGAGDLESAERYFGEMRSIFDATRSMRFAEAVLRGFRRKQDTARIQLENAASDILSFKNRFTK